MSDRRFQVPAQVLAPGPRTAPPALRRAAAALALTALVALGAVAACRPEPVYPACARDEQCAARGEVCVAGRCSECRGDGDCRAAGPCALCDGLHCRVRPACCAADGECDTGVCNRDDATAGGYCAPPCGAESPCPAGRCCTGGGRCVPCLPDCLRPAHCDPDFECLDGRCRSPCLLPDVLFAERTTFLSPAAREQLAAAAACLREQRRVVRLRGHADDRLDSRLSFLYAHHRVLAVRDVLVRLGVPAERLLLSEAGSGEPLCRTPDEACRARNRRVQFIRQP